MNIFGMDKVRRNRFWNMKMRCETVRDGVFHGAIVWGHAFPAEDGREGAGDKRKVPGVRCQVLVEEGDADGGSH